MKFKDWNDVEYELPLDRSFSWRPSAYALVKRDDQVLLMRAKQHGRWELPGGGINLGEKVLDGLVREVFEETGYQIKATNKVPYYLHEDFFYAPDVDKYRQTLLMFFDARLVNAKQETSHIDFEKEVQEVAWLLPEEIRRLELQPKTKEAILLKIK